MPFNTKCLGHIALGGEFKEKEKHRKFLKAGLTAFIKYLHSKWIFIYLFSKHQFCSRRYPGIQKC